MLCSYKINSLVTKLLCQNKNQKNIQTKKTLKHTETHRNTQKHTETRRKTQKDTETHRNT